jgi:hypothetical protein
MKRHVIAYLLLIGAAIPTAIAADTSYSPEQLLDLMEASMQRYESMTADTQESCYQISEDGLSKELDTTYTRIWRWTKARSYCKVDQRNLRSSKLPPRQVTTLVLAPEWQKRLVEIPGASTPRGYITQRDARQETFYSPMMALWDIFCEWPWQRSHINLETAIVERDEQSGLIIFRYRLGVDTEAPVVILHVDAEKDFVPIVKEYKQHDGQLILRCENVLEKSASGLWIPKQYQGSYGNTSKATIVTKLEVNVPISPDLLDFAFPSGTRVVDEIGDLRYQVDDDVLGAAAMESSAGTLGDSRNGSPQRTNNESVVDSVDVRELATQEELEKTVNQAHPLGYRPRSSMKPIWVCVAVLVLFAGLILLLALARTRRNL